MIKKVFVKKDFLSLHKNFSLILTFGKHTIRIVLASERGVIRWKTSRSEGFIGRTRTTRLTAQALGDSMGGQLAELGIKQCEVRIKGADHRASFTRAILFAIVKRAKIKISGVKLLSKIRFGGTKLEKRANRKGKGKKKKKLKAKKKKKIYA